MLSVSSPQCISFMTHINLVYDAITHINAILLCYWSVASDVKASSIFAS